MHQKRERKRRGVCIIREGASIKLRVHVGRWSEGSIDRLSGREVGAMRKLDKKREERKCNIAIKGINWERDKYIEKGKEIISSEIYKGENKNRCRDNQKQISNH